MELTISRKLESSRKLNTKGCCFLCLQSEKNKTAEHDGNQVQKLISIGQLLRHLEIPAIKSLNGGSLVGHDSNKEDIQVELCKVCGQMINRFSVLFKKLEKIQLEMDYFLEMIHKCIYQSAKDTDLVQNYSKRMTSDLEALSQLAFVDNLRKQVAKESSKKINVPRLRLILTRAENKLIKTETTDTTCETNDSDFTGNFFADNISPPPSPNSTADNKEDVNLSLKEKVCPSPNSSTKQKRRKRGEFFTKNLFTGMYECKNCDKKSKSSHIIAYHFKSDHLKLRHKCDICNISVYKKPSQLNSHKKTCRENLEKELKKEKDPKFKFICKICMKKFETYKKLTKHTYKVHKNANRFQCDLCDKKYSSSTNLKTHQSAIHQSKKFYCKICNKMYKYMHNLKTHEKSCVNKIETKLESVK